MPLTTGKWYKKSSSKVSYNFKKHRTSKCKEFPIKLLCTSRAAGKEIDQSQFADLVEENNKRYHLDG